MTNIFSNQPLNILFCSFASVKMADCDREWSWSWWGACWFVKEVFVNVIRRCMRVLYFLKYSTGVVLISPPPNRFYMTQLDSRQACIKLKDIQCLNVHNIFNIFISWKELIDKRSPFDKIPVTTSTMVTLSIVQTVKIVVWMTFGPKPTLKMYW